MSGRPLGERPRRRSGRPRSGISSSNYRPGASPLGYRLPCTVRPAAARHAQPSPTCAPPRQRHAALLDQVDSLVALLDFPSRYCLPRRSGSRRRRAARSRLGRRAGARASADRNTGDFPRPSALGPRRRRSRKPFDQRKADETISRYAPSTDQGLSTHVLAVQRSSRRWLMHEAP